jgi:catechol 2,3-dioxygenase-like lactoylglutathione lyase family enzyme
MVHGIRVSTVNLSSADPHGLARFYADLLGLGPPEGDDPTWVVLRGGTIPLAFELDERYRPPVWPTEDGQPPTQVHLEVLVDDLEPALAHALACGATLASYQPQDDVRVCLDPAGHPFCLWVDPTGEDPAAG